VEDGAQPFGLSTMFLAAIALLIPVIGFIMTISHARAGDTRQEQRWRKGHGLLFWVLIPGIAGVMLLLGFIEMLPRIYSVIGIIVLAIGAAASFALQKKHERERPLF
jgi:hypothetical protein